MDIISLGEYDDSSLIYYSETRRPAVWRVLYVLSMVHPQFIFKQEICGGADLKRLNQTVESSSLKEQIKCWWPKKI